MTFEWRRASRRDVLTLSVSGAAAVVLGQTATAVASPAQVEEEIKKLFGGKPMSEGKIKLDLPAIADNGLAVPLSFDVESPMTDGDYVKAIHFFSEGNPNPVIAAFRFTPLSPRAAGQVRIRLAQSQNIVAVAEISDGKLYKTKREVNVTIGGCGG